MAINKVRFVSDIQIDPNGTLYLSQDPNGPHYIGPPSPEIDQAWDALLLNGGKYLLFSYPVRISELPTDDTKTVSWA